MEATDELLVGKLEAYLAWAAEEPRITGCIPWHWNDLGGFFKPATMTYGAVDFPKTLALLARMRAALGPPGS